MKPKLLSHFLTAAIALGLPQFADAQHPQYDVIISPPHAAMVAPGTSSRHMPPPPFVHGIALKEAQQDEMFKIMHATAPAMHQHTKVLHQAREELRTLAHSVAADEASAKAAADKLAKATAEIELLHFRMGQKYFSLLTPEQRQKIQDGMRKEKSRH